MLLRRVLQHLKSQHWTAVGIDFAIVVLGVFVGLQVSNWNEARHLDARKSAALQRMLGESEAIIAYLDGRVAEFANSAPIRTELLERLTSGRWQGADVPAMTSVLTTLSHAPALAPPRGVYDELINTGMFAELGDPALRDAISSYYAQIDYARQQIDYFRSMLVARTGYRKSAGARVTFDAKEPRQMRMVYDFPALSADADFVAAAIQDNYAQSSQLAWTRTALERAKAMCTELARYGGDACKPTGQPAP